MDTELRYVDNEGQFNPEKEKKLSNNNLVWSTDKSAKVSIRAIQKRKREYKFTAVVKIMCRFGYYMPGLYHYFMIRMGKKTVMNFED